MEKGREEADRDGRPEEESESGGCDRQNKNGLKWTEERKHRGEEKQDQSRVPVLNYTIISI